MSRTWLWSLFVTVAVVALIADPLVLSAQVTAEEVAMQKEKGAPTLSKSELDKVAEGLKALLADLPGVKVTTDGVKVILTGKVTTTDDRTLLQQIAEAYEGIVVNLAKYDPPAEALRQYAEAIQKKINLPRVHVDIINENIVLFGEVDNEIQKLQAVGVARAYLPNVVDNLRIADTLVEIDIIFALMDLAKAKELGVDFLQRRIGLGANAAAKDVRLDEASGDGDMPSFRESVIYGVTAEITEAKLQYMIDNKVFQVLARPHLSALTNKTATVQRGGERVYELEGANVTDIKTKPYGLTVSVTPIVIADGLIRATVSIEYSTPVPKTQDFITYKTSSEVTVRQGESIVVSGLRESIQSTVENKIPILGDIPILDLFFNYKTSRVEDNELVLIITPTLPTTFTQPDYQPESKGYEKLLQEVKPERLREQTPLPEPATEEKK